MRRPALLTCVIALGLRSTDEPPVSFDREVRPILSQLCFRCHGPDAAARKAQLRLDTKEGLFATRQKGRVVHPGAPGRSLLWQRITASDPRERMPPVESHAQLSPAQIETLRRWIGQGAAWQEHWAFAQPKEFAPGQDLDDLVRAPLRRLGRDLAPEAAPAVWLRRVSFDLTGLAPSPEELATFCRDPSPAARVRVVDRLLASPRYGERMAWDWLDAARYADTNGFQHDHSRSMWPWRDWVVRAFNANLPYDQFLTWQLAGDLLPDANRDQRLATAFLRNHMINGEGGRIPEENRVEYIFDQVETVGTVFLGLTLGCCRCHDHKFDPLSQRDYFRFFAYFNQTPVTGKGAHGHLPPLLELPSDDPKKPHRVMVMRDRPGSRRKTWLLRKGLYNQRGAEVQAGTPAILPPQPAGAPANRLGLARWLTRPDHPLTARVLVNRVWQRFFGRGLVATPADLGTQGAKPSHPGVLDGLARDFVRSGFDLKRLQRRIVLSRTYAQSAAVGAAAYAHDPDNLLLGRGPRRRLPSFMIRDHALATSGLLDETRGGPGVRPYQPPGIWAEATFGLHKYRPGAGSDLYRRSLYTFWRRIVGPPQFFDNARRQTCEVQARLTNTPLHALATLNGTGYVEASRVLAARVFRAAKDDLGRLDQAYLRVLSRQPETEERRILLRRLASLRDSFAADPTAADRLLAVGAHPRASGIPPGEHAAWQSLCSLLLNLDEALSR